MKRILLIDEDDQRRATRVMLLQGAGYEVITADRFELVEDRIREGTFDLVITDIDERRAAVTDYANRVLSANPDLPVLLLSGNGAYLPRHTLLSQLHSGHPLELLAKVAAMLLDSTHQRESQN